MSYGTLGKFFLSTSLFAHLKKGRGLESGREKEELREEGRGGNGEECSTERREGLKSRGDGRRGQSEGTLKTK